MIAISDNFKGLSEEVNIYDILNLVKRFGKKLGFTPTNIAHLEYLLNHTKKNDWASNGRPIVFKSVSSMAIDLNITERQVNEREKQLHSLGALCWKDTGNHKRGGFRSPNGNIVYAYGVDLSPLAALYPKLLEQKDIIEAYKLEWIASKRIVSFYRRKISAIQSELTDIHETGGLFCRAVSALTKRIRASTTLETLHSYKQKLKTLLLELETLILGVNSPLESELSGKTSPRDAENFCHIYSTNYVDSSKDDLSRDTPVDISPTKQLEKLLLFAEKKSEFCNSPKSLGSVISEASGVHPSEIDTGLSHIALGNAISALSPRFKPYFSSCSKEKLTWASLVEAADYMSFDLSIPKYLWAEACGLIGRNATAVCIIILDQNLNHPTNPIRSPAAVLRGMIQKARVNDLHLHRSLFGILERLNTGVKA